MAVHRSRCGCGDGSSLSTGAVACQSLIGEESPVDDGGQSSFQAAHGLAVIFACGAFVLVVGASKAPVAHLAQGDEVEGVVEPAVAGAGEPVPDDVSGGDLQGRRAAVGGEVVGGREAADG